MSERDGGPAFPSFKFVQAGDKTYCATETTGATLRDFFAAAALVLGAGDGAESLQRAAERAGMLPTELVAQSAYAVADAMLAERERERT